jgi:ABC-type phosphate/phosphonate transport system substrate-binding protein
MTKVVVFLLAAAGSFLSACSSSSPRDMNYGTDVALGYHSPDSPPASKPETAPVEAAIQEAAGPADAGVVTDTSPDQGG